jgi:outer membrane receptor protein involved in Fe transport
MIHATSKFGKDDRWTLDTKVQYINAAANNRPINGQNASNYFATLFSLPRSLDIRQFNPPTDQYGKMIWFNTNGYNPYWLTKYNLNQDTRDRFLMYASLTYDFTKWLNLNIKAGSDLYSTRYLNKTFAGSPLAVSGSYGTSKDQFFENDYSTLLTAHKDNIISKLGGMLNLGGNLMYTQQSSLGGNAGSLVVPNLFTLNNAVGNPSISQSYSEQKINSLYGSLQLNWDGYLFLDGTLRNDWTSTLSPANRSFFYPSVNFSWVINDMLNKIGSSMPSWFDFAKLRASFAQVGNSLSPYQLYNTYSIGKDPLGSVTASNGSSTLFNANVKNELITSYEVGTELHFLQNRLSFDVSLYKSNATRQLLNLPIDPMSGYSSMKINAGNIQNQGIEVQASARILELRNSFTWDLQSNFSMNQNKIISLAPGVTKYQLGGYDNLQILAATGQNYGAIYGTKFARVSDPKSSYYGQMILQNGLPSSDGNSYYLGSQQPNALWSITSSWGYKGFRLSMMFDMRFGGKMYSATNFNLQMAGVAAVTAPNGQRQDFVVSGVTSDGNGGYTPNTTKVTVQDYWTKGIASSGNLGIDEANVYDATNFRIRNVELSYDFNKNILRNTPFQAIRLSASCNNVVMLYSKMHGVDPEAVFATSTNATGFENASQPTLRTYTFNVTFGF